MVDATAQNVGVEHSTDGAAADEAVTVALSGAVSFPELVRAHYAWERGGCVEGPTSTCSSQAVRPSGSTCSPGATRA